MSIFPLVDQYTSIRLGQDVSVVPSGALMVVESDRRTYRETSYGFIHALWWIELHDRGAIVSVPQEPLYLSDFGLMGEVLSLRRQIHRSGDRVGE